MELTRTERILLSNQYRILEALYPDEKDSFAYVREALESGYEGEYNSLFQHVYTDTMSVADCREVIDTLAMFDMLMISYDKLSASDRATIKKHDVTFSGFDGNNETAFMAYAEFFCTKGFTPRFEAVVKAGQFNSHFPAREKYAAMRGTFERIPKDRRFGNMTRDEIQTVVDAG